MEDKMTIRKYEKKDAENLRTICHKTATAKQYIESKELVCTLYCDYYFEQEPENIFVVADQSDKAVGYILCAEDYKTYFTKYNELYLEKVKSLDKKEAFAFRFHPFVYKKIAKEYPAHMHIDLLPVCQGQGLGKQLIEKLIQYLKDKGVCGLCLTVGADNKRAIKFYEKLGFKKIKNILNMSYVYAISLNK